MVELRGRTARNGIFSTTLYIIISGIVQITFHVRVLFSIVSVIMSFLELKYSFKYQRSNIINGQLLVRMFDKKYWC